MTVKVAGVWEHGWNTPILEYDLWRFPMREFDVSEWYMCPISGIDKKVSERKNIEDILEENKDIEPVFVDEEGDFLLEEFVHPENCLYVCGKAGYSPAKLFKGTTLKISTPGDSGRLWGHQAAILVLYDRYLKCR